MDETLVNTKCQVPESCTYWFCHHHQKCLLHEHVQRNEPKELDSFHPVFNYFSPVQKKKNRSHRKPIELPEQPLPISIDNFFIRTRGVYDELKIIPNDFKSFFKSRGSEYFTNDDKTHIIRVSDHWGFNIRFCAWFLKETPTGTYDKISSFKWKKNKGGGKRIGIIHISNFSVNGQVTRQPKPKDWKYKTESRWPE